jgi:hypothetical protein
MTKKTVQLADGQKFSSRTEFAKAMAEMHGVSVGCIMTWMAREGGSPDEVQRRAAKLSRARKKAAPPPESFASWRRFLLAIAAEYGLPYSTTAMWASLGTAARVRAHAAVVAKKRNLTVLGWRFRSLHSATAYYADSRRADVYHAMKAEGAQDIHRQLTPWIMRGVARLGFRADGRQRRDWEAQRFPPGSPYLPLNEERLPLTSPADLALQAMLEAAIRERAAEGENPHAGTLRGEFPHQRSGGGLDRGEQPQSPPSGAGPHPPVRPERRHL